MVRAYELMIIFDADAQDAAIEDRLKQMTTLVEADGGSVATVDKWGRRRFAYEINKKTEGIYVVVEIVTSSRRGHRLRPVEAEGEPPMAFDNTITVVGNVTRDPELRFTPAGAAVANFGVAWNLKRQDGEDQVSFFDVTCWRQLAENVAESLTKGMRVVVYGRLEQRSWQTQDGEKRSKVEIIADEVAPSLKWATAEITRNDTRGGGGGGRESGGYSGRSVPNEPPPYDTDEEPF